MKTPGKHTIDAYVILETMTESVLITTTDLEAPGPYIIYVNPAFEKMTGWLRKEIIGKSPRILQGPKTDRGIFKNLNNNLRKGESWTGRTINYRKDGSEFFMQWSITPVKDKNGVIVQYLAIQQDITQSVKIEEKLQRSRIREKKGFQEIKKTNLKLNTLISDQKKMLDLFIKYVPEAVVMKALDPKSKNLREGELLDAALLFCDIRHFTTIAEKLTPSQVVHFLNVYYSMMSEVIKNHKGVIAQFVGDEIFVVFGAPVSIKDPEISAVRCAIEMVRKLDDINKSMKDFLPEKVVIGIGVNFGPIIAGNLGSEERLSYSITGDAVNTAKRIEALTRELPDTILISETIYEKSKNLFSITPWGKVRIKGKNKKVNVFQVII